MEQDCLEIIKNQNSWEEIIARHTITKSPTMYHDVKKPQGPGNEATGLTTRGGTSERELKAGVSVLHPSTTLDEGSSDASIWPRNDPLRNFVKRREEGSIAKMELRLSEIL